MKLAEHGAGFSGEVCVADERSRDEELLAEAVCRRHSRTDVTNGCEWRTGGRFGNQSRSGAEVVVVMVEEVSLGFVQKSLSNGAALDVESPR